MIIKKSESKDEDISELNNLLKENIPDSTAKKIQQEIKNIRAGAKGEKESAYEIDFHLGDRKNIAVIHNLRLEHNGIVAQIDHLFINRLLEIYVCESKHFAEGISVNDHGEFTAFYNKVPYGVASPIEQNKKHIQVLKNIFNGGSIEMPKRLGVQLMPKFHSVILVSKNARINRPKVAVPGLESIIKNDSISTFLEKDAEPKSGLFGLMADVGAMSKVCSAETIMELARELVKLDRPIKFNWRAKFGLGVRSALDKPAETCVSSSMPTSVEAGDDTKKVSKLVCTNCAIKVDYAVAKFCWFNKPKFGGDVFCKECQKNL